MNRKPSSKSAVIILIIIAITYAAHRLYPRKYWDDQKQAAPPIPEKQLKDFHRVKGADKKEFISFLLPKIREANRAVYADRAKTLTLYNQWKISHALSQSQLEWLQNLATRYLLKDLRFANEKDWQLLLKRVDIIPASLVLAQAINESAWGNSYFAMKGHNYFGQHCYYKGCGIVPLRRSQGASFEVKKYKSAFASIVDYVHNLNTQNAFQPLRAIRVKLRQTNQKLSGIVLSQGLLGYSEKREAYITMLKNIINNYHLATYNS